MTSGRMIFDGDATTGPHGTMALATRAFRCSATLGIALLALAACGGGGGDPAPTPVPVPPVVEVEDSGDVTAGEDTSGDTPVVVDVRLVPTPETMPTARGLLPDIAPSDEGFESDHFSGNAQCGNCHVNVDMVVSTEAGPRDVSINTAWETSTMANAARDPYWHAVVAYELDRFPMHEEEIDDTCTRCHAPMANEYAKKTGGEYHILDKGSEEDGTFVQGLLSRGAGDALFDHAMDGVSCTLCHQIDPENLGVGDGSPMPESSQTGGFRIVDYTGIGLEKRPAYAQYEDPDGGYMQEQSGFLAQPGAHMSRSETCATCHNLNVEPIDKDGVPVTDVGHFAEQANYTEWLNSDYREGGPLEQSCQDCHMPTLDQAVVLAEGSSNPPREGFREHTFLGANTVMQTMMRDFAEELGIDPELDFDTSIARNRAFLETSATIELGNLDLEPAAEGATVSFDVDVVNETGHKLPTGYHSRRVWLHVQVVGENGEQVFESGRMNADGSIVGVAEDVNPIFWEGHHDVITSARQVQVYQAIVGNSDGERTQSLLNGSFYLKDNRLTPKGFDKRTVTGSPGVAESFGVFGEAMADDDFDSGRDTVSYRVAVPSVGRYTVRAALRYQPISFGHLNELFRESGRVDEIDRFRTIYAATPLKAEGIAAVTATVE